MESYIWEKISKKDYQPLQVLEEEYDCMPASGIFNRNTQFLLGIEEAVQTTSIFKRMPCSILGFYASNDFGLVRSFSHSWKISEVNKRGGFGGFIRNIMNEDGFSVDEHSHWPDRSTLNKSGIQIYVDTTATDPFVHTCMSFNNVQNISGQKSVSCEWQRAGRKQFISIVPRK